MKWPAPADVKTLVCTKDLPPLDAVWSAFGISRYQMEIVALSTMTGGHCRVGLEDNIYRERGVFATNGQLAGRAARDVRLAVPAQRLRAFLPHAENGAAGAEAAGEREAHAATPARTACGEHPTIRM